MILLCGCKVKKSIVPITSNFSADICIEYEDFSCEGNIDFVNISDFTVNITSPETINGLKVDVNADKIDANYKGLNCTNLYDFSSVSMFLNAMKNIDFTTDFEYDDGKIKFDDYEIDIDENGFIKLIEFDEYDLKIYFRNQKTI
ncbi:MAG: hypothetical protein II257_05045 [Clostridia bacterium]|nr:hypothetical protein [Clostridia bacterium]